MTIELTAQEIQVIKACLSVAVRSAPDSLAAARDVLPIADKLDAARESQESQQ